MYDFEVKKFTRVCFATERELKAGDVFYAYLVRDGRDTLRRDVCEEAWDGPPEDCIAWWKSSVPDPKSKKLNWAPNQVLVQYFQDLGDKPENRDLRYVLALLLVRRKVFKLEETAVDENGETLVVLCTVDDSICRVPVVKLTRLEAKRIQAVISELIVDAGSNA